MISAGIICVSEGKFVMVKRTNSFAYGTFLRNQYPWSEDRNKNRATLIALMASMVQEEKNFIYSLHYEAMWFRFWHIVPYAMVTNLNHRLSYDANKAMFEERFLADGGDFLRQTLQATPPLSVMSLYDFPRGRVENESLLAAAKREMYEETKLTDYEIVSEEPFEYIFHAKDQNRSYTFHYFVARFKGPLKPPQINDYDQRLEIDDIILAPLEFVAMCGPDQARIAKKALEVLGAPA